MLDIRFYQFFTIHWICYASSLFLPARPKLFAGNNVQLFFTDRRWNNQLLVWHRIQIVIFRYVDIYHRIISYCLTSTRNSWIRDIESKTGKSARRGNLRHPRFPCLAVFASVWFYFSLLSAVFSFVFVCKQSYFPFMSIKKLVPYFCVLCEGYYVIIWPIVRICVFIKDWKLIYSELFILKRKSMENWGEGQLT